MSLHNHTKIDNLPICKELFVLLFNLLHFKYPKMPLKIQILATAPLFYNSLPHSLYKAGEHNCSESLYCLLLASCREIKNSGEFFHTVYILSCKEGYAEFMSFLHYDNRKAAYLLILDI